MLRDLFPELCILTKISIYTWFRKTRTKALIFTRGSNFFRKGSLLLFGLVIFFVFVFSSILTKLGQIAVLNMVNIELKIKRGMTIQISPAPNRRHSKMCRDFWKKLPICIFGCPKLYLGWKKLKKNFFKFFIFHRGDPYDFS